MSFVDFSQQAEDHTRILILILPVGSIPKPKNFSKIYERISRLQSLTVPTSPPRSVRVRYRKYYAIENNAWGDFQVHRRVLGLLTVGHCEREDDLAEVYRQHEQQKEKYESTLLDSRLILFDKVNRMVTDEPAADSKVDDEHSVPSSPVSEISVPFVDPLNTIETLKTDSAKFNEPFLNSYVKCSTVRSNSITSETFSNGSNSGNGLPALPNSAQVLRYKNIDECPDLEEKIQDFLASLFWVLESKRLDRSYEKLDHLLLLTAPFELRKDASAGDLDSRIYKKRCQGRLKKHLGDLCLLAGVCNESILHYQTSIDLLKATNDTLWMAGAYEGLASASVVLLQPQEVKQQSFQRNSSFSLKRGLSAAKEAKSRSSGTMSGSLQLTPNGLDLAVDGKHQLQSANLPDDILENYKEAVINYSKFKDAGVVEMEASLKACRVLIAHQRFLAAADFLQNIVYINIQLMEEEKIQRFMTLASLYSDIQMTRKAAFYSRIAAMQCVSPTNQHPSWAQCYQLLLQALPGYGLSLDPKDMPPVGSAGWTSIQLRVLHELVFSSRRMGNAPVAIRHLSFLLHTMFDSLPATEMTELAGVLKSYTNKCESTALSLALDDGTILPPVPLTRFPTVRNLRLLHSVPHCQPVKFRRDQQGSRSPAVTSANPFIYSPIFFAAQKDSACNDKRDIHWCEGDVCEVILTLSNPLPFDIDVVNLALMTEGVEVVCLTTTISLPPNAENIQAKIQMKPRQCGTLTITGYSTQVLGVRSHCRLRDMRHLMESCQNATIIPCLPMLQVSTSLPKTSSFCSMTDSECVVTSGSVTVFAGQSITFAVDLINTGKSAIERIDISAVSAVCQGLVDKLLSWNEEQLLQQLPIEPESKASLTITVTGISRFLSQRRANSQKDMKYFNSSEDRWSQLERQCVVDSSTGAMIMDTLILLQYSGGTALQSGFCRQCSISLNVEILPSLVIDEWMVMHASRVNSCSLAVDVINTSSCSLTLENAVAEYKLATERIQLESELLTDQVQVAFNERKRVYVCIPCTSLNGIAVDGCKSSSELSQHVSNFVDIRWSTVSSGAVGRLSLEAIDWTLPQCSLLQACPVSWTAQVDGRVVQPGSIVTAMCSCPLLVHCTVTNCTDDILTDIELSVDSVKQSCSNPSLVVDDCSTSSSSLADAVANGCAILIGPTRSKISQLAVGSSLSHTCSFMFTSCVVSHVSFRCSASFRPTESASEVQQQQQHPHCVESITVTSDHATASSHLPSGSISQSAALRRHWNYLLTVSAEDGET